jgi:HSP20 family protein
MFGSLIPWRDRPLLRERFPQTFSRMEEEMEDLMTRLFRGSDGWLAPREGFLPLADVTETDKDYEVVLDLPGMKPEEVTVELKEGQLWVTGRREEEREEKGKTFHRVERQHGEFRRVIPLPSTIDEQHVDAHFDNGVLKITVPKTEGAQAKRIEVKA